MHDATEGGVIGGLYEIAAASEVGMEVEERLVLYPPEVRMVCEAFGLDPLYAIAEGSLLITARTRAVAGVLKNLSRAGIAASVIGRVTARPRKRLIRRTDGRIERLAIPTQDPFWPAFFKGLESH